MENAMIIRFRLSPKKLYAAGSINAPIDLIIFCSIKLVFACVPLTRASSLVFPGTTMSISQSGESLFIIRGIVELEPEFEVAFYLQFAFLDSRLVPNMQKIQHHQEYSYVQARFCF